MRAIVPIGQLARRIPEAGRIRIGKKQGNRPTAIGEFRFTSHDEEALTQIARIYGGTVRPWSDPKAAEGQHEVITDAAEIRIVLPPDPLGGTPIYELWGGGGCDRRCDGLTCTTMQQGPEGPEPTEVQCLCLASGSLACKPTTRLSVILPDVRFAGVWRLDTKSWNAAQELPGMVDMIRDAQENQGMPYATLAIRHRRSVVAGKTSKFLVPVLGIGASIEQLVAGTANLTSIGDGAVPDAPALEAGQPVVADEVQPPPAARQAPARPDPDDDVVDAEIVDDVEPVGAATLVEALGAARITQGKALRRARELAGDLGEPLPMALEEVAGPVLAALVADLGIPAPAASQEPTTAAKRNAKMHAMVAEAWATDSAVDRDVLRKHLIYVVTKERTESSKELEPGEWDTLFEELGEIIAGTRRLHLSANGWVLQTVPKHQRAAS